MSSQKPDIWVPTTNKSESEAEKSRSGKIQLGTDTYKRNEVREESCARANGGECAKDPEASWL